MDNNEINELVARKLLEHHPENDRLLWVNYRQLWCEPDSDSIPQYATDIKAAWEIVEKRKEFKRDVILLCAYERPGFCCRMVDKINGKLVLTEAGADTAPLAICKAFLKLEETK